jgi:hypothetical protein
LDHQLNGVTTHSELTIASSADETSVRLTGTISWEASAQGGEVGALSFLTLDAPAYITVSGTASGNSVDQNAASSIRAEFWNVTSSVVDHWGNDVGRGDAMADFTNLSSSGDISIPFLVDPGSYGFILYIRSFDLATTTSFATSGEIELRITSPPSTSTPDSGASGLLLGLSALVLGGTKLVQRNRK